jgi:predicted amidophosphoribosyltransferase
LRKETKIMSLHESSIPCPPGSVWHYFLCHYLPLSAGIDAPSRSLLKFKRGAQPDLDAWTDCALTSLREIKPPLSPDTIIVRALHHLETRVTPSTLSSLDYLGQAIAAEFHCTYLPSLLTKTRPTHPNKGLTVDQRNAELQDIYSANTDPTLAFRPTPATDPTLASQTPTDPTSTSRTPAKPPLAPQIPTDPTPAPQTPPTPFLLIDDLLTTGATARMIIGALRLQFPSCPIRVFTLGKVDHEAGLNHRPPLAGNIYRLDDTAGWKQSC